MSQALYARCRHVECGNRWVVAHLPMPIETVAELARRAACAQCGDLEPVVAAAPTVSCSLCGRFSGGRHISPTSGLPLGECGEADCDFPNEVTR